MYINDQIQFFFLNTKRVDLCFNHHDELLENVITILNTCIPFCKAVHLLYCNLNSRMNLYAMGMEHVLARRC